ncbi:hypothetical protein PVAG01_06579 [Phlyctema vagabunda]|uniref:C2H2-type domain-containing protein n=1 Tax=Phlyctema vagabunda TaxID=108571 RepID=A0ABR4PGL7_9HELO
MQYLLSDYPARLAKLLHCILSITRMSHKSSPISISGSAFCRERVAYAMSSLSHDVYEPMLTRFMTDDQRVPGYGYYAVAEPEPVVAAPRAPVRQDSLNTTSSYTSSASTGRQYSTASGVSAASTASTAPTDHPTRVMELPQPESNPSLGDNIRLPCEFVCLGCNVDFPLSDVEAWISHSESHFTPYNPPTKAICTICDEDTAHFEDESDPLWSWRDRMLHIREHFIDSSSSPRFRPDFWVLDFLRQIGHMTQEEYDYLNTYDERPYMENVHPLGYQPPQVAKKAYKQSKVPHDMAKEEREWRRSMSKGKTAHRSSRKRSEVKVTK